MVTEVNAKTHLGNPGVGISRSQYFLCSDNQRYLVKFYQTGNRTTVNEFVVNMLAREIGLQAPGVAIVTFTEEQLRHTAKLHGNTQAREHVGVKVIENSWNLVNRNWRRMGKVDPNPLYGVFCMDNWIRNIDRNKSQNILVRKIGAELEHWMIDAGHAFGSDRWNVESLDNQLDDRTPVDTHPFIRHHTPSLAGFRPWIDIIKKIRIEQVESIINAIPNSWNLEHNDKAALIGFIMHRKNLLQSIIDRSRGF